ncbi:MAG: uracil-DNA glycosylase [Pseudomonadota bacterium]
MGQRRRDGTSQHAFQARTVYIGGMSAPGPFPGPVDGPHDPRRRAYLRAALAWQLECGVDEAIAEAPIDRRAVSDAPLPKLPGAPPPTQPHAQVSGQLRPQVRNPGPTAPDRPRRAPARPAGPMGAAAPLSLDEARTRAATLAEGATDVPALERALAGFDGSSLKKGARSTVFADGNPAADVMVIGEAPGRDEDRLGKPFVGRSGGLLDRMLNAIGLDRAADDPAKAAYITNVIFYRPLENRTPDDAEVRLLMPFTERHIALARPKVLLCLGAVPAKHVMGAGAGITKFRGTWSVYSRGGLEIPALATFHPAFLLRSPEMKRLAWRDLLSLEEKLETLR